MNESRLPAILSYITIIGCIIAIILHYNKNDKNPFNAFHIRQALGLFIVAMLANVVCSIPLLLILQPVVIIITIIFAIIGLMNAANGHQNNIPIIGKYSEQYLSGIQ